VFVYVRLPCLAVTIHFTLAQPLPSNINDNLAALYQVIISNSINVVRCDMILNTDIHTSSSETKFEINFLPSDREWSEHKIASCVMFCDRYTH